MAGCTARRALLVLLSVILLSQAAPGMGVAMGPDRVEAGNPVSVNLTNVTDGILLNLTLTAVYTPPPETTWLNVSGWKYPFALQGGRARVDGRNVNQLALLIRVGDTFRTQRGSGAGNITLEIPLDFLPMTEYDFRIGFEPHTPDAPLTFILMQQGTKQGMEMDAFLSPSFLGMEEGNVTLQVFANGTLQERKEIQVQAEVPPSPPPEENITATQIPTLPPTSLPETVSPVSTPPSTPAPATPPPVPTPPATVGATPTPVPDTSPAGPSPWILAYGAAVIVITLVADYYLLRD